MLSHCYGLWWVFKMGYTWNMVVRFSSLALLILLLSVACSPVGSYGKAPQPVAAPTSLSPASPTISLQPPGPHIQFGRIGLEAGLSQSSVMAIIQDRQGFMWFGTEDGLNRYDGEKFKIFRPVNQDPTSISDVWISALGLDSEGTL
jgi:hypothetical protein